METVDNMNEFQDWEVLHPNSDSESTLPHSVDTFDEIDLEGKIQANYFSLDSRNRYVTALGEDSVDYKSNYPSWIDPGLDENPTQCLNKESDEFWSDSSSDRSGGAKFNDFVGTNEMGSDEIKQITLQKVENAQILEKDYYSMSGEVEEGSMKLNESEAESELEMKEKANLCEGSEVLGEEKCERNEIRNGIEGINEKGTDKSHEIVNRGVLRWKMPIEFMRYWVFRVSPAWTVSVAAAAMIGFLIVGRRLYKMKKKTRSLQIKVTVDDKKVSQVMNRAARLNEAFYVVKRLPIIRPSLPAVGVTTWPATSLR